MDGGGAAPLYSIQGYASGKEPNLYRDSFRQSQRSEGCRDDIFYFGALEIVLHTFQLGCLPLLRKIAARIIHAGSCTLKSLTVLCAVRLLIDAFAQINLFELGAQLRQLQDQVPYSLSLIHI